MVIDNGSVTFSVEMLEFFMLVVARLSAFIYSAPFFSQNTIPRRVKAALSVILSIVIFQTLDYKQLEYVGVIGFGLLVIKEVVAGVTLGYAASICLMILSFAGNMIDTEIGFSMVQTLNPLDNTQSTITGNLYSYSIMLVMLISNMHLRLLQALIDTFTIIPVGKIKIPANFYTVLIEFIVEYFILAFRIILPIFMCILLTNVVLAILARVAPQMNLFVIGIQLKIIIGLAVLIVISGLLGAFSDFIFNEMVDMMRKCVDAMKA